MPDPGPAAPLWPGIEAAGRVLAIMAGADHTTTDHVEDIIRGVRAIAKALRTTPAQVHELRARHGLPTFLSGRTLCARWSELAAWIEGQDRR